MDRYQLSYVTSGAELLTIRNIETIEMPTFRMNGDGLFRLRGYDLSRIVFFNLFNLTHPTVRASISLRTNLYSYVPIAFSSKDTAPMSRFSRLALLLCVFEIFGCGSGGLNLKLYPVKGKVIYKGKPIKNCTISLMPIPDPKSKSKPLDKAFTGKLTDTGEFQISAPGGKSGCRKI